MWSKDGLPGRHPFPVFGVQHAGKAAFVDAAACPPSNPRAASQRAPWWTSPVSRLRHQSPLRHPASDETGYRFHVVPLRPAAAGFFLPPGVDSARPATERQFFFRQRRIRKVSSAISQGFKTNSSAPRRRASIAARMSPAPVRMKTQVCGARCFTALRTPKPSTTGIFRSVITRSNFSFSISSIASLPLATAVTVKPSARSSRVKDFRMSISSSTSKMDIFDMFACSIGYRASSQHAGPADTRIGWGHLAHWAGCVVDRQRDGEWPILRWSSHTGFTIMASVDVAATGGIGTSPLISGRETPMRRSTRGIGSHCSSGRSSKLHGGGEIIGGGTPMRSRR